MGYQRTTLDSKGQRRPGLISNATTAWRGVTRSDRDNGALPLIRVRDDVIPSHTARTETLLSS